MAGKERGSKRKINSNICNYFAKRAHHDKEGCKYATFDYFFLVLLPKNDILALSGQRVGWYEIM